MSKEEWQEKGIRIGGEILDERDAKAIVAELRKRVKDRGILEEVDRFLNNGTPLSQRSMDALRLVIIAIMVQRPKDRRRG